MPSSYLRDERQVVIGAASRVRYSVSVVACTAADALAAFEKDVREANRMQKRLPSILEEMEGLKVCNRHIVARTLWSVKDERSFLVWGRMFRQCTKGGNDARKVRNMHTAAPGVHRIVGAYAGVPSIVPVLSRTHLN